MHIDVIFDMETRDPDDMFALCFLASHPAIAIDPEQFFQTLTQS